MAERRRRRRRVIPGNDGDNEDGSDPAAAGVARREENSDSHSGAEDDEQFALLIARICSLAEEGYFPQAAQLDSERAARLLEASSGDLDLAASLYWDDFLASNAGGAQQDDAADESNDEEPTQDSASRRRRASRNESGRRVRRRTSSRGDEQGESAAHGRNEAQDEEDTPRRVWRRLVPHWLRQLEGQAQQQEEENEADDGPQEEADDPQAADELANDVAEEQQPQEASVSVSDDENESAPIMSIARRSTAQGFGMPGNVRRISDQGEANEVAPAENKAEESDDDDDDDDEDYLSDSDWVLREDDTASVKTPLSVLWGGPSVPTEPVNDSRSERNGPSVPRPADNSDEEQRRLHPPLPDADHVVAEDDDDDNDENAETPYPHAIIVQPWRNAGFNSSTCASGLIAKPPTPEEITLFRWQQSQAGDRNQLPPPYHCRGLTALLSVVTALIYSGASVQGKTISCLSGKTPFADLSEEERKQEFESRLADALSALLFLAAKASLARKTRGLAKRAEQERSLRKVDDDSNMEATLWRRKQQAIQRRLALCPTCWWEDDYENELPDGKDIRVSTSFTSLQDLRNYVLSNMRAFTSRGGCALFLETIVRIHGESNVERMLRRCRRKALRGDEGPLINCTCKERQKDLPIRKPSSSLSNKDLLDTTPLGHGCMSTELLSLLLTGQIHSTFKGWSTNSLGLGILDIEPGEIGTSLMKPSRPVWVLRGETCYSVLWYDSRKERFESMAQLDRPGNSNLMTHWNCWYGLRNKSVLRVITSRNDWAPPTFRKLPTRDTERETITQTILRRRREQLSAVVSSDELAGDSSLDRSKAAAVTSEEIDQVKGHPDDMAFYPNDYKKWRFDVGGSGNETNDGDLKTAAGVRDSGCWTPYFRLNSRQKLMVEMKLAPKINRVIWTRWPGANVRLEQSPAPVV